jgi:hypothetical protein
LTKIILLVQISVFLLDCVTYQVSAVKLGIVVDIAGKLTKVLLPSIHKGLQQQYGLWPTCFSFC